MSYRKDELLWWLGHPGFEKTQWWMRGAEVSGTGALDLDEEHPELLLEAGGVGEGRSFDPAPIFWETLRRHPAMAKLARQLIGLERLNSKRQEPDGHLYKESDYIKILHRVRRQMDLSHEWQRAAFHLITGHQLCWTSLEPGMRSRFRLTIPSLIKFLRPYESNSLVQHGVYFVYDSSERGSGECSPVAASEPGKQGDATEEAGLSGVGPDRSLGALLSVSNFLKRFRFDAETERLERVEGSGENDRGEAFLQIEKMETEFRRVGLELMIFGFNPDLGEHALTKSFRKIVADRKVGSPTRIRPTSLVSITKLEALGRVGEHARKNINDWFRDYDLERVVRHFTDAKRT